jgi:protein involved in polysaccharide export with SLBB domain
MKARTQSPSGRPGSFLPFALLPLVIGGWVGAAHAGTVQIPSNLPPPSQAAQSLQQAVQQNPGLGDIIRQRLQESGLTAEQVRARLQGTGYPANLLDAYLTGSAPSGALPAGALELAAIQALGLPPAEQSLLQVDTGLIRMRGVYSTSRVFGVDVFRRTTTQFLPLLAGPVPPDYRLGPGDVLVLIITGNVELAYTLQVTREGFILIPQAGQLFVSNLTLEQLHDVLYTRLGRVYSGVRRGPNATTRFDVSVANVRVNQVYVVGEVGQPGAYQISSLGTVFTALYAAGGLTERANMRQVEVRRLSKPVGTLDLYDYLLRGDTRSDVRLETGDVVFVPVHGIRAEVSGAVVRPAIYELKGSETLPDLLRDAGGFRPEALLKRLAIYRLLPAMNRTPGAPPRAVVDVSLSPAFAARTKDPLNGVQVPGLSLEDGDSVVVDAIPSLVGQYYVAIAGMVQKPGIYPWRDGMTLRDLVLLARGPLVGADLREAEVARMPEDRTKGQLATTIRVPLDSTYLFERDSLGHYFGPPGVPFPANGAPDVRLQPYDNVLIERQPEFDFQRTVVVTGEVRHPGTFSLRTKSDRLAEVLGRAGGLTAQSYPEGIRFVRAVNNVGRVNVDLRHALRDTASGANIILQPGDWIEIPEYQPAVKVSGAVNSPGSVLWRGGEELDYYLQGAGGFTYRADKGKVSVKYANGEVRTRRHNILGTHDPRPGPGSEVFVPVKDSTEKVNYVALFGAIAQIVASTVTIIYVIHHP